MHEYNQQNCFKHDWLLLNEPNKKTFTLFLVLFILINMLFNTEKVQILINNLPQDLIFVLNFLGVSTFLASCFAFFVIKFIADKVNKKLKINNKKWRIKIISTFYACKKTDCEACNHFKPCPEAKKMAIDGSIVIKEKNNKICISWQTETSSSDSTMASLEMDDDKEDKYLTIVYAYRNIVKNTQLNSSAEQSKMRNHDGFCQLYFSKDFKKISGFYFNDNERRTQGWIEGELSNE